MSIEKIRVLIVDDVAETRKNVRELLQFESDVSVIGMARTGREAVQQADELLPDVIIMDINMPDMDGIAATEAIRAKHPEIQVVMLSIQSDQNYMRKAMLVGARDFLTKPPMGDELISAIRRAGDMANTLNSRLVASLHLEETQLRLVAFDLDSRLDLYRKNVIDGKLVDDIEALVIGLAHDIRSPLNIILSIISTAKPNNEGAINAFRKIWRRSIYCKWVADNFLGISLSEKISVGSYSLKSIVSEVFDLLENRVHEGIELVNEVSISSINVDPSLLRLTLLNLLTNSLESMPEAGKITVRSERQVYKTALIIEDNGLPIATEDVQKLFRLGFTTKKSHTGVGLYVSKRLLRQQNGDLTFARDFHHKTKLFGILLPDSRKPDTRSDSSNEINSRIDILKKYVENMQEELGHFRNQVITDSQQEALSFEFQRLTTVFSKNLSNELLLIEATVLETIKKLPPEDETTQSSLKKIIRNCAYCRLLTNNILALGEGASPKIEDVSILNIIDEVLLLVDRKMPPHLFRVEWDVDPLIPNIKADVLQIQQVFMNLIKNALDAMPSGGTLKLKLTSDDTSIVAEVGDTGVGISSENMSRLFQLGFTTKTKGYGIGLYSIKKIIEQHKGKISVSSKLGKGTVFKIKLPLDLMEAQ